MSRSVSALVITPLVLACAADHGGTVGFGTGGGASSEGTAEPNTSGETLGTTLEPEGTGGDTAAATSGDDADDAPLFDLGVPDLAPSDEGCTKVDLLFVVDASYSMQDEQDSLVASFPDFITEIQDRLGAHDYHIGIVTTEAYEFNEDGCTDELGQLVTRTGGEHSSAQDCGPFAAGGRYMTVADDLASAFACAADVGIVGDTWERPMQSMLTVIGGAFTENGGCNDGFLRDDSLLVVVVITDEADGPGDPEGSQVPTQTSAGTPETWFEDLVSARGDIETNIVVLSLNMFFDGPCPPVVDGAGHVEGGVFDGTNIHEFTQMFTHGFAGGICKPSYAEYFAQAVDVVAVACEQFEPQG